MDLFPFDKSSMRESLLVAIIRRTLFVEKTMNLPKLWWLFDVSRSHENMLEIGWWIFSRIFLITVSLSLPTRVNNDFLINKWLFFWIVIRGILFFIDLSSSRCDEEIRFTHVHCCLPPLFLKNKFILILSRRDCISSTVVHWLLLPFVNSHHTRLIWLMTHKRVDIKAERRGGMRQNCLFLALK